MLLNFRKIIAVGVVLLTVVWNTLQVSFDEYVTLTANEKKLLDLFKTRVSKKIPNEYMKKEIFLIPWLRETDFDINASEKMFLDMIKWRKENDMDNISQKDFSDFRNEYRGYLEGCDKKGRPILSMYITDWDVRRAVLSGKTERFKGFINQAFEEIAVTIRDMQADGQKVAQGWLIIDLSNFNLLTHGCPNCITIYLHAMITIQTKYVGLIHKLVVVNTPQVFLPLWNAYKYVASPKIKQVFYIFDKNKKEWQSVLRKEIDSAQITENFGGNRTEALDTDEFRNLKKVLRCTNDWKEIFDGQ